jgi:hypothetical protein
MLLRYAPQLFHPHEGRQILDMDRGILRAFLLTKEYRHGARSMEAVVAMSLLAGKTKFERSSLPTDDQLDLHVDGKDFLASVHQIELEGTLLERLAKAAHDVFCESKFRAGWRFGARDNQAKTHPLLIPYEELAETYKESNRHNVRTIPKKLSLAGYVIIPDRGRGGTLSFSESEVEALARFEHELWMDERISVGFKLGKATPEDPQRNEFLVAWEKVPENIKQIDRDLVRDIPKVLSLAGYTIARVGGTRVSAEP